MVIQCRRTHGTWCKQVSICSHTNCLLFTDCLNMKTMLAPLQNIVVFKSSSPCCLDNKFSPVGYQLSGLNNSLHGKPYLEKSSKHAGLACMEACSCWKKAASAALLTLASACCSFNWPCRATSTCSNEAAVSERMRLNSSVSLTEYCHMVSHPLHAAMSSASAIWHSIGPKISKFVANEHRELMCDAI